MRPFEVIAAAVLIVLGLMFLALNLLGATVTLEDWWPLFVVLAGLIFFLPLVLISAPRTRRLLAALAIPGSTITGLGLILLFCSLSNRWEAWAYLWALLPAFVGLGLIISAAWGQWSRETERTGRWLLAISLAVAFILGLFFELFVFAGLAPQYWPVLLIAVGLLQLVWIFWPRPRRQLPDHKRRNRV